METLSTLIHRFVQSVGEDGTEIYNEFSLQHELGLFLRSALPDSTVQFERNVCHFAPSKEPFTKREIDITVFSPDRTELKYAIELKYPRNGQYPEQMFSFCKDIAFAEELKAAGFAQAGLLIFADARPFYAGAANGIYGHFRAGRPITGRIEKPTGAKDGHVHIQGSYTVSWLRLPNNTRYAFIEVGSGEERPGGSDEGGDTMTDTTVPIVPTLPRGNAAPDAPASCL